MSVTENSPLRTTPNQIYHAKTYDMTPECSNINFRLNLFLTQTMKQLVKRAKRPTAKDMQHGRVPYEPKKAPSLTVQQMLRMCAYCLNTIKVIITQV